LIYKRLKHRITEPGNYTAKATKEEEKPSSQYSISSPRKRRKMDSQNVKKIFVVDDDAMLTEALTDYLGRKTPHQIFSFNTGE